MPTLSQALNAQLEEKKAVELTKEQQDKAVREAKENDAFQRLDRLIQNEDWKWFHETYLMGIVDTEKKAALAIKSPPDVRSDHAHRYDISREIVGKVESVWKHLKNRIEARK